MIGRAVVLPDGRTGIVKSEFRDTGNCKCLMVIVTVDESGRDWIGKRREVRANARGAYRT